MVVVYCQLTSCTVVLCRILSDGSCDAVKSKACVNDVSEQHPLDDNPTSGLSEFLVLCLLYLCHSIPGG